MGLYKLKFESLPRGIKTRPLISGSSTWHFTAIKTKGFKTSTRASVCVLGTYKQPPPVISASKIPCSNLPSRSKIPKWGPRASYFKDLKMGLRFKVTTSEYKKGPRLIKDLRICNEDPDTATSSHLHVYSQIYRWGSRSPCLEC